MVQTTYYASPTDRRKDGIPIGQNAQDAEYLRREHEYNIFAIAGSEEVRYR